MAARPQAAPSSAEAEIEALYKKMAGHGPGTTLLYRAPEQLFSQAGDVITKKRNRLLEESSSAVLLIRALPPLGDAAESDRDMEVERQALGEGMGAQQEDDFNSGSDLTDKV
ncbi:hypothetical protein FN846DRAFT_907593 [Sphaerosporella brunnea]|uniref:Uncharacterized protein n=1 Tax=Sphaerosporella brunnea TaxID=1250544 RepID=A0A5J5EV91_9PEZI|nr:hypothetical protein FN846DRAFT_907593 [Sphaerosporella brunnea]